jgi:hypothetical protein
VFSEGPNRCKTLIARRDTVAAFRLEVIEEGEHLVHDDVVES